MTEEQETQVIDLMGQLITKVDTLNSSVTALTQAITQQSSNLHNYMSFIAVALCIMIFLCIVLAIEEM